MTTNILRLLFIILLLNLTIPSLSQDQPLFSFGVMTDVQYANRENQGSRHYRSSLGKLQETMNVLNEEKVDFVLHLGDLINDNFQSYDTLLKITSRLDMPLYLVPGNHEFAVEDDLKDKILPLYGYGNNKGFCTFEKEGRRFILLDGTETGLIRSLKGSRDYEKSLKQMDELKAAGAKNAFAWNGGLSSKQFRWLKRKLNLSQRRNEQVILACHYPLLPSNAGDILLEADKVRLLVERYPDVVAWFNGHTHKSRLIEQNGISYVSFRGMVEEEDNAFAVVKVFVDHLEIKGYGKEVSRMIKDKVFETRNN